MRREAPSRTAKFYSVADARSYIGHIEFGCEILGLTKGQFSLSDLIHCIAEDVGPCDLDISTWTAAGADAAGMVQLVESGKVRKMRWVVDDIFIKRQPGLSRAIIKGGGQMRILKTHAKFAVFRGDDLMVALRTSMNLNANPRIEYFEITEGLELVNFFTEYVDSVFKLSEAGRVKMADIPAPNDAEDPLSSLI